MNRQTDKGTVLITGASSGIGALYAVLPGATATEFWGNAGKPVAELPPQIVMSVEDLVDAALAGFDQGEFVTIPSLPNVNDWQALEAARLALHPNLSDARPALRYAGERSVAA